MNMDIDIKPFEYLEFDENYAMAVKGTGSYSAGAKSYWSVTENSKC